MVPDSPTFSKDDTIKVGEETKEEIKTEVEEINIESIEDIALSNPDSDREKIKSLMKN